MTSATTPRPVRTSIAQAAEHIATRRPFVAGGGSMHGEVVTYTPTSVGRLDPAWARELDRCVTGARKAGGQTFVVWSYGTPIAWTTPDGTLTMPAERYSVTTCKHQHAVRQAIR